VGGVAVEVHVLHAGIHRDGLSDLFVSHPSGFDDEFEGGIVGPLVDLRLVDITFFQESSFLKQFEEILFVGIHAGKSGS
jgi:hypothetical protein